MSSMHTPQSAVQPFAVVRKGFDREQVNSTLTRLEAEVELLRADRDSAVARAERAATDLERERERVRALEARVAELGRAPATSDQMSDRLATMLRLATAEAESVRDEAHSTADRIRTEAEDDAWQLREAAGTELKEIRTRNLAIHAQHDETLRAARKRAQEIVRSAERRALQLDAEAAARRDQIDEDHRLASDLRRQEALREHEFRQAATAAANAALLAKTRGEADEIVATAHAAAKTMIDRATAHTEQLRELRRDIVADLAAVRARLEPVPGRIDHEEPLPDPPALNSSDA